MAADISVLHAAAPAPARTAADWRRWALLPVVLSGTAMVILDFFIVNVAIPAVQKDLHAGTTAIEWVVAGYGLAFASGLILGGRLGDLFGRRRMFVWGVALFTLTSAACGIAPSANLLIEARVAQGVASALLMPQVLAILGVAYEGRDRVRAFTAYAMTLGLAAVCGQLVGGSLIALNIAGLGWRACFLVNIPIGLAALALTPRFVPPSRPDRSRRLDLVGAAVITLALVAIVLPLIEGREQGWPAWTWACLAAAPLLFAFFAHSQRQLAARGGSPLVPPVLFTQRSFTVGLGCVMTFYGGMASYFLLIALYLQNGRHLSALSSGLVFGVLGLGFLTTSTTAQRITARLGRTAPAIGAGLRIVGLSGLWFAVGQIGTGGNVAWLFIPLLLDGAGLALLTGPLISTVLARVPPEYAGAASGVLATAQQVGNAVGVAVIGIIYFNALDAGKSLSTAFRYGLLTVMGLSLMVAAATRLLPAAGRVQPAAKPVTPDPVLSQAIPSQPIPPRAVRAEEPTAPARPAGAGAHRASSGPQTYPASRAPVTRPARSLSEETATNLWMADRVVFGIDNFGHWRVDVRDSRGTLLADPLGGEPPLRLSDYPIDDPAAAVALQQALRARFPGTVVVWRPGVMDTIDEAAVAAMRALTKAAADRDTAQAAAKSATTSLRAAAQSAHAAGISLAEIAARTGYARSTVTAILNGPTADGSSDTAARTAATRPDNAPEGPASRSGGVSGR